jgi:transposase
MEREPVSVSDSERAELERLIRGRNTPQKVVLRARIVVLTADSVPTSEIMQQLQTTCPTITRWRQRYAKKGVDGLCKDATRPGRKPRITDELVREVIERTLHSTPVNGTHWSTRTMAAATGLSKATIQRLWRGHGLQPHRTETFKLSRDPQFLEKLQDVVGRYLDPPEKAIVFSVDEKSQIQALDRTQPGLPMKAGRAGTMTPRLQA